MLWSPAMVGTAVWCANSSIHASRRILPFMQRQDVWIDSARDDRFVESDLARELKAAVFILLPVCEARTARCCLHFDWIKPRDKAPDTFLPGLTAMRGAVAMQTLAE